jgi:integrase
MSSRTATAKSPGGKRHSAAPLAGPPPPINAWGRVLGQTDLPKSPGSLRDIDVLPPVRQARMEQKALSWLMGGFVFLDGKQPPVHQALFRMKFWEPLLKRLGIRYRPPYQMWHTFATLATSVGEKINWVARMLGHKSPVETLEKYNRFVPNRTRRTAGRCWRSRQS